MQTLALTRPVDVHVSTDLSTWEKLAAVFTAVGPWTSHLRDHLFRARRRCIRRCRPVALSSVHRKGPGTSSASAVAHGVDDAVGLQFCRGAEGLRTTLPHREARF
jgi:hypothetical protein